MSIGSTILSRRISVRACCCTGRQEPTTAPRGPSRNVNEAGELRRVVKKNMATPSDWPLRSFQCTTPAGPGIGAAAAQIADRRPSEMSRTWHDAHWLRTPTTWRLSADWWSRVSRPGFWGPIRAMPKRSSLAAALECGLVYFISGRPCVLQTQGCHVSLLTPGVFECTRKIMSV